MKKILAFFGLGKKENSVKSLVKSYDVNKYGYKELFDEDQKLYDVARSFVLDYKQEWDDKAHKQKALFHVLRYVRIPFAEPKFRDMTLLKRDFKRDLRGVDCTLTVENDQDKVSIVKIANVLLEFKYRSIKLRKKNK